MRTLLFSIAVVLTMVGCQSRPVEEMALADVAVKAAQKVKADALAADAFRRAENYYLRAKRDYQEGYYDSARKFATDARKLAEQAEYKALQKQVQVRSGAASGAPEEGAGGTPPPEEGAR